MPFKKLNPKNKKLINGWPPSVLEAIRRKGHPEIVFVSSPTTYCWLEEWNHLYSLRTRPYLKGKGKQNRLKKSLRFRIGD